MPSLLDSRAYDGSGGSTASNNAFPFAVAQTFTVTITKKLYSAVFYLYNSSSGTGTAHYAVYNITGTPGSNALPTGSPLAVSDSINISSIGGVFSYPFTPVELLFTGSNSISLSPGDYMIAAHFSSTSSNDLLVESANDSGPGNGAYQFNASPWGTGGLSDYPMQVYDTDVVTQKAQTGVSRIQVSFFPPQFGISRITVAQSRSQAGRSRITASTSKPQVGRANIQLYHTQPQVGKSFIVENRPDLKIKNFMLAAFGMLGFGSVPGVPSFPGTYQREQIGRANILVVHRDAQVGCTAIILQTKRSQTGIARITRGVDYSQNPNLYGDSLLDKPSLTVVKEDILRLNIK